MAKKHKNRIGGFEAPRNSLDLPAEPFQSCYTTAGEYVPYKYDPRQRMSKSGSFSANFLTKKLIGDEFSEGPNSKQHSPGIVARLMGMDVFPSDTDSIVQPFKQTEEIARVGNVQKLNKEKVSNGRVYKGQKPSRDRELHSSQKHAYSHLWSDEEKLEKPRSRLHPQEKELQQFKKNFEAWQASRFLECARVVEASNISEQWTAQLNRPRQKMAGYENFKNTALVKHDSLVNDAFKPKTLGGGGLQYCGAKSDSLPLERRRSHAYRKKSVDRDYEGVCITDFDRRSDKSYAPARIVILKPGPENFSSTDESWLSSSGSTEERDRIEDLLEEVKEKLRSELHGKAARNGSTVRSGGIVTPFKDKPVLPNHRARDHRTSVRENSPRDPGRKFLRSESTRLHRSEVYAFGDSLEFNRHDTRQNYQDTPDVIYGRSIPSGYYDTRGNLEQARNILDATDGWNRWNDYNYEADTEVGSFRHEHADEETFLEESSPRNLVRSLSAPVPGTSFGKLLLEDRHILTGAHIRRKHEALESVGTDGKGQKKERLSIRENVSNVSYNFTLKGKMLTRKFHSFDLSERNEFELMANITSGPTVLLNLPDRHENHTEVPPSPASVCSSSHEELCKPADHPSPSSSSDLTSVEDQNVGEISSNPNELRRELTQLDCEGSEVTTITEEPAVAEMADLEDESQAYIRDLLVASGLYDGTPDDSSKNHVGDRVFERVEESYRKQNEKEEEASKDCNTKAPLQHKLLFDLLNDALPRVFKPPKTLYRFGMNMGALQGRLLLDKVWEMIRVYIYSTSDNHSQSLDNMPSHDLGSMPWFDLIDDETKAVGEELEAQIAGELVEQVVKEMLLTVSKMKYTGARST